MKFSRRNLLVSNSDKALKIWTLLILILSSRVWATSPSVGADISVAISQQLMAAPPIPSLEQSGSSVAVQFGIVETKMRGEFPTLDGQKFTFSGGAKGSTGGLSFSSTLSKNLWIYFFALGTTAKGNVDSFQNGIATYSMKNISSESVALSGGFSYRVLGTEKSFAALGVFAGPYLIKINSKSTFTTVATAGPATSINYEFNPLLSGLMIGVQSSLRFARYFVLSPYVLIATDLGPQCQTLKGDQAASSPESEPTCGGKAGMTGASSSFAAFGSFVSLGIFRFNIYAKNATATNGIYVTSYSGSIGISY